MDGILHELMLTDLHESELEDDNDDEKEDQEPLNEEEEEAINDIREHVEPTLVDDDPELDELFDIPKRRRNKKWEGPSLEHLYKMPKANICSDTTEKKIRPYYERWKEFCRSIGQPDDIIELYGLSLYHARSSEDVKNPHAYDRSLVDKFMIFVVENRYGKSAPETAKTFLNTHLKCEHYKRQQLAGCDYADLVEIKVGESLVVKSQVKLSNARAASEALDNCEDIQGELEQFIPAHKLREMILYVFEPIKGGEVEKLCPIYRLHFVCAKTCLDQTVRRGEELRPQLLIQRSSRFVSEVGPHGVVDETTICNKAKHNQDGHLEITKLLPHYDPLRCSAAHHGLMMVHRLCAEKEKLPDFLGDDYKAIYSIHTYPAERGSGHVDEKEFNKLYHAHYDDAKVVCQNVMHLSRKQGVHEMDGVGVPEAIQRRMTGHKGKEQTVHQKSYARRPPTMGLVQRAGGNPFELKKFNPVVFERSPREEFLLDMLTRSIIPGIMNDYDEICSRHDGAKSAAERAKKRLSTIKGMLGWIKYCVECMFLMMAAPLVDPVHYKLTEDRTSLWELQHLNSLSYILNLEAFHSVDFQELQRLVLRKMERAEQLVADDEPLPLEQDASPAKIVRQNFVMMRQGQEMLELMKKMESHARNQVDERRLMAIAPKRLRGGENNKIGGDAKIGDAETGDDNGVSGDTVKNDQFLADGVTKRKRRRPLTQQAAISAEYQQRHAAGEGPGSQMEYLCDKDCKTFDDYHNKWINEWQPLEINTNGEWRKDRGGRRASSAWWTQRSCFHHVYDAYRAREKTHDESMDLCRSLFNSVPVGKGGKRPIKGLSKAFKDRMKELEVHNKGRPPNPQRRNPAAQQEQPLSPVQPLPLLPRQQRMGNPMVHMADQQPRTPQRRNSAPQQPQPPPVPRQISPLPPLSPLQPWLPHGPVTRHWTGQGGRHQYTDDGTAFMEAFPIDEDNPYLITVEAQAERDRKRELARWRRNNGDYFCSESGGVLFEDGA